MRAAAEPRRCPRCGMEVPARAEFCPHCGVRMASSSRLGRMILGCLTVIVAAAFALCGTCFLMFSGFWGGGGAVTGLILLGVAGWIAYAGLRSNPQPRDQGR